MTTVDLSTEELPQRMRIRKGRVMHRVIRHNRTATFGEPSIESMCRRRYGPKGAKTTCPRADGPASWWFTERYWYLDCPHCPADQDSKGSTPNA